MTKTNSRKTILIYFFTFIHIFSFAQNAAEEQIINCLSTSDFFLLEEIYPQIKDNVQAPYLKAFAESLLYSVFNQPEQGIASIDSLIAKHQGEIGLENIKNMLIIQCWQLFRRGEYQQAYEKLKGFVDQIEPHVSSNFLVELKANMNMFRALLDENKPQLIRPDEDCVIPLEIDTIRIKGNEHDTIKHSTLMYVPVTINGSQERCILDTGCGGGIFLSQEYATRLGARIIMDSLVINGAIGKDYGQMGIIDSIEVGNMIFKNVTATIVPPNLELDSLFKINAVLGVDIMDYAGELQIFPNERKVIFPFRKTPLPPTGRNMMRNAGSDAFFLKTYSNNEKLIMLFDTGDAYSHLNASYFKSNKEFIKRNGLKNSGIRGGFGGSEMREYFYLPSFPMKIGNKQFDIKNIIIESQPSITTQFGSGALGMAFINSFKKITINFDQMFVEVDN